MQASGSHKQHACRVLAVLQQPHALVLRRVAGQPLAAKPNLQSLLRCRWPPGVAFSSTFVARVALCVASALQYLHAHCICHGDVYAHNILVDTEGNAILLDYGAFPSMQGQQETLQGDMYIKAKEQSWWPDCSIRTAYLGCMGPYHRHLQCRASHSL